MFKRLNLSVVIGLIVFSSNSHGVGPAPRCSLETLRGTYLYASSGIENGRVNAEGGIEVYDGRGSMNLVNVFKNGEVVVSKGQYKMGESCMGGGSYDLWGTTYVFYATPSGGQFTWNAIGGAKEWSGVNLRTTRSLNPSCTPKTLKGTYIYNVSGALNGAPYFESGKNIYDGVGVVRNIHLDARGKEITTEGKYTLGKYCAGSITLKDKESIAIYTGPKGDTVYEAPPADSLDSTIVGVEYRASKN